MNIGKSVQTIVQVVFVCGCIYAAMNWDSINSQADQGAGHAEQSCIDGIRDRFNTPSVSVYAVDQTNNGYVVRASITLPRGAPAKVHCLTNEFGGVEEIRVEER